MSQGSSRLADAFESAALSQGLNVKREHYRALEPVETSYGPAFDLRELGADKVLAISDRAEPRDFIDLARITKRFPLEQLISLAADKDPGLDLVVLAAFLGRAQVLPAADFELDDQNCAQRLETVRSWQVRIGDLRGLDT